VLAHGRADPRYTDIAPDRVSRDGRGLLTMLRHIHAVPAVVLGRAGRHGVGSVSDVFIVCWPPGWLTHGVPHGSAHVARHAGGLYPQCHGSRGVSSWKPKRGPLARIHACALALRSRSAAIPHPWSLVPGLAASPPLE
jgi:hypothetical protein